ncbi:hypothetical protein GCM10022228_02800 [Halomonas cibimaris]|uniref:OmpA-like domain-containing protein n=1 Tax=Halomonas cibimaris TaxID=657012 RepID=A0ABP7L719_9GAMM
MKKSTTGLLLGSALAVGLSGCASSASQSEGQTAGYDADKSWYQHPMVCGLAGSVIGGGLGYATTSESDEDSGAAIGATAGAALAAYLCADKSEEVKPQCPGYGEVPAGVAVDAEGCPLDSDNDGVADYRDQCPGTPAGVAVDAKGCPLDSDNDGVADYRDQCPNTPAGEKVNALGCPENLVLDGVHFEFDSAKLTAEAEQELDDVAEKLVHNANARVRIEGHTDAVGSARYNKELSQRRAESVASYLQSNGVHQDRMKSVGYGEERPIATNETPAGRAENRRVMLDEWK